MNNEYIEEKVEPLKYFSMELANQLLDTKTTIDEVKEIFDETHELILNSLYSFYRAENTLFTSWNILQHIFGNVADHFQSEFVGIIEQHLDELKYMRISMDLKDKFGNNAHIKLHGEKYRPVELEESLLDVSILKMKSAENSKIVKVYRINRLSPIFKCAEKLKQITSWQTELMKVPVRKTIT